MISSSGTSSGISPIHSDPSEHENSIILEIISLACEILSRYLNIEEDITKSKQLGARRNCDEFEDDGFNNSIGPSLESKSVENTTLCSWCSPRLKHCCISSKKMCGSLAMLRTFAFGLLNLEFTEFANLHP
jgi:hypothetical protein